MRSLAVLVAPDSFKGSLSVLEVSEALAVGWQRARPDDDVLLAPLADGGEGTLAAIAAAGGWIEEIAEVTDPIGRPVAARWLRSADRRRAVVEMAAASGLSRLAPHERDPHGATSHGTGELIATAVAAGATEIILGIGGSATNDGAAGILRALGAEADHVDDPCSADLAGLDPRLGGVSLRVACDVRNPLLGPEGAAAVYGPQKGASPADVAVLDARLARWADALEAATGRSERHTAGAGAAGGVGFGLLCVADAFASFSLEPGIDLVMEATGFAAKLARADLVITGEGRVDAQTAFGKTAQGVADRAAEAGVACIVVGGGVEPGGIDALAGTAVVVPVTERPMSVELAMAAGVDPVERCGERIARLVSLGAALA